MPVLPEALPLLGAWLDELLDERLSIEKTQEDQDVELSELRAARLVTYPLELFHRYRPRTGPRVGESFELKATVKGDDSIEVNGRLCPALSTAAADAIAPFQTHASSNVQASVNGWEFWSVDLPDGRQIKIEELRKIVVRKRRGYQS